jgi:hypothetical protein
MATRSDRPDPDPNRPAGSGTPITPPPVTSSTTIGASGSAGGSTVSGQATITRESNTGTGDSQQYGGDGSQQYGTTITEASVPPPQIRVRGIRTVGGEGPRPIVLKVRRRGRRGGRKRYSKNTKDVQRLAYGSSKAIYRVAEGLAAGTESFWRRSNRSARRKKDGLAKDFYRNAARGVDRFSRQAGKAPWELAREISGRRSWKNLRWWARNAPFRLGYYR